MVKNGNFTLLLTSTGQGWEFNISIVSYRQIHWQIFPPELTSSGQGWQLPDLLPDLTPNALWDIYYGMYLVAIWILQEKVRISFYL